MRKCADIFTWIGGILTPIYYIVYGCIGVLTTKVKNGLYNVTYERYTPTWLWVIFIIMIVLDVVGLIWRQLALKNGHKVGCGVFEILFVSKVGGVLTLCIPEYQLY